MVSSLIFGRRFAGHSLKNHRTVMRKSEIRGCRTPALLLETLRSIPNPRRNPVSGSLRPRSCRARSWIPSPKPTLTAKTESRLARTVGLSELADEQVKLITGAAKL